jgi:cell division ATPase FtsA
MTTELPSIGYKCLLCGNVLTQLENNYATEELNRIISERTNEQFRVIEKEYKKLSEERLQQKELVHKGEIRKKEMALQEKDRQLEEA